MFNSVPTFCIFCFGYSFLTKPICHTGFQGLALSNTVLQFIYFFHVKNILLGSTESGLKMMFSELVQLTVKLYNDLIYTVAGKLSWNCRDAVTPLLSWSLDTLAATCLCLLSVGQGYLPLKYGNHWLVDLWGSCICTIKLCSRLHCAGCAFLPWEVTPLSFWRLLLRVFQASAFS